MSDKDDDILDSAKEAYKLCQDAEADNRKEGLDDLRFARLSEQWPDEVKSKRAREGRPTLTFNRMPTFIRSVVNDGRQNKPAIKVHPADDSADIKTAEVINGLIRNIEYTSNADVAYDTGLDFAASCGFGFWRVSMEYAHDDSFDMDLCIERIANPFAVYGDPHSTSADSSDWNVAFVVESMPKEEYEQKYKKSEKIDWDSEQYKSIPDDWRNGEEVVVAEYWTRKEVDREIAKLSDGRTVSVDWLDAEASDTEELMLTLQFEGQLRNLDLLALNGISVVDTRTTKTYKVKQYILSGAEVLEENDWPGRYIPVVPVYGEELNIEGKRYFRSLIRDAKDAQRNYNYWRTTTTELVALAPKAPWVGAVGQFDTDNDKWQRINVDNVPYVEYDASAGDVPPQRQPFAGVPAGALQEALNSADDMKSIIGIYDASLGARSNETSGRAINARKTESETSTFHFIDNQARAIRHTGRILIDLIPHVYSQPRIIRIMGEDKKPSNVPINQAVQGDPNQQNEQNAGIYDLTAGKYDLTVSVGPGFQTKREEAAYGMTELIRAFPPSAAAIAPALAKTQDWPGAEEIAAKLEALAPKPPDQNQQMAQQMQQMNQVIGQLQQQLNDKNADRAVESDKTKIDAYNAETNRLKITQPMMGTQEIQALVMQTIQQVLQSPDVLPMQQMPPPQMPQQMNPNQPPN